MSLTSFGLVSTLLIFLTSSEAFEHCVPTKLSVPTTARVTPSLYACDVCWDNPCDAEQCAAEVHILAVQSPYKGIIQVDTNVLPNRGKDLDVILVLSSENPTTWEINLNSVDIRLHHVHVKGDAVVEFWDENDQPLSSDREPIVVKMQGSIDLDYSGTNIDEIYNMGGMTDKCVVSFTGVKSTGKFTLAVGIESSGGGDEPEDGDTGDQQSQQNIDDLNTSDLFLLIGAVAGGSMVFFWLVGFVFVALRKKEKEKKKKTQKAGSSTINLSEVVPEPPPPRYSQVVGGKSIPPPPSTPLPPAPGENIYSELGEGGYLEPRHGEEGYLEPSKLGAGPGEYEGLRPEQNPNFYQKLGEKVPGADKDRENIKDLKMPNKQTGDDKDYEKLKEKQNLSEYQGLDGNDKDENGYLKLC